MVTYLCNRTNADGQTAEELAEEFNTTVEHVEEVLEWAEQNRNYVSTPEPETQDEN